MNKFELEKRTLDFSKKLINVLRQLPRDLVNNTLMSQLIRSGTSIGANYREANGAESKRDFKHKINIVLKESAETAYWLELLIDANPNHLVFINPLFTESVEFVKIFGKVISTLSQNIKY